VAAGLDGEARPETLAPADFARLLRAVRAAAPLPTPGAPA
jgi:hypothetical protein